jgi:hypothetical protein
MTANHMSLRFEALISSFFCVVGLLALDTTLARAQSVGDWQVAPVLAPGGGGVWDNSTNNSLGNTSTWQMYTNSGWVTESGTIAGTSYPNANTGLVTIPSGTTVTNSLSSTSSLVADGIIVQTNATFLYLHSVFELAHNDVETTTDLDVFGTLALSNGSSGGFSMDGGATIVVESGGKMTNYGATSGDNFFGGGYGSPGSFVPGAITFRSNSLFVLAAITNKGTIPAATWNDGSTCLIAPTWPTNFVPPGMGGQSFYDFIWNYPNAIGKNGGSGEGGSFTVRRNMTFITGNGATNEDFPYSGNTLTVGGNLSITNITWYPTASAGTVTLVLGGNFIVDSTASIKINSASGLGDVIFNGTGPQTVGFYGANSLGSTGSWDWTVTNGSTVNLDSALTINGTSPDTGGLLNIYGTLNFTANGSISGTSNLITVAPGAILNVSQNTNGLALGAEEILQGAGTITGSVSANSTSVIHPGTGAPLTFNGNLVFGSATSTNIFNLTSTTNGTNDQIVVGGSGSVLTGNNAQIVINPVNGTLASADYVLFNVTAAGGSISSAFNGTPAWTTPPANSNDYTVVTSGTKVLLHYAVPTVPQPVLTGVSLSGTTNLTLNGTNGEVGSYVVLMSTNVASTNWTPVATNALSGGTFSIIATNVVTPGDRQQFYILKAP